MSETRDKIASLSPEELAELAGRLSRRRTPSRATAIEPRPRDGRPFPLSFAQQRLWFLHQLDPASTAYNIVNFLPLAGARPDLAAMRRSLEAVVMRHEIFRTTYRTGEGGEPVQVIHPAMPVELAAVDLSALPRDRFERAALDLLERDNDRPFDLATGPLLRSLVFLAADRAYWGFAYHHIVSDWWSATLFYREVMEGYERFVTGQGEPPPAPRLQYADFAAWERERLDEAALGAHLAFWRERLASYPPLLELPTDRPRPAEKSGRGGEVIGTLPAATMAALKALREGEGATTFMVLLAVLDVLLLRLSGEERLVVGSAISNRERPEVQEIIGFFVNTLVFAADLEGDPTFRQALARVKAACLDTFAHQELPFDRLVAALAPEREPSRNPLFEVIFGLERDFAISERVSEEKASKHERKLAAKFDLTWQLLEESAGTTVKLEYSADLFDRATAARWVSGYGNLVAAALARPDARLSELALLSATEEEAIRVGWNRTAREFPGEASLAALFAEVVAADPSAPAVDYGDRALTYSELAAAAAELAAALAARGVGPGGRVGLLLERSAALVTAMLAVVAVGAAYVPLDPAAPAERLIFLLDDAGVGLVLVSARTRGVLPGDAGIEVVDLDSTAHPGRGTRPLRTGGGEPDGFIASAPSALGGDALAYVMYTSGSTGRPKGIAVPARAIARLVRDTDYVRLGPGDRVAQVSNTAFDATTFEIWGALLNGATLVGLEREVALEPERLAAFLVERRISTVFLTTALFNLVAERSPAAFSAVREVLFGGQLADPRPVARVLAEGPPARLLHVYGPTESTTFATWEEVTVAPAAGAPPIGRPLANTTAYVADRRLVLLPAGVPGELLLGGDGLAWGYGGRAAATAEAFIPDPWSERPGARLYRTGDVVRRAADGRIAFLGRRDGQVKIRGFRIEPGEIEAALATHAEVGAAAVLAPADERGERRLVAFVERAAGAAARPDELRAHLAATLPDYMLPAAWVVLDRFPLNANGKVDRRALEALAGESAGAAAAGHVAPRTPLEATVAGLYGRFLGLEQVGVHDDFFALGGHSLLATQVVSRLREEVGPLALRDFFEASTPALLAARLAERGARPGGAAAIPALSAAERAEPLPLSFGQERLWFLHRLEPGSAAYNMPEAVELAAEEPLDRAALARALAALAARHEVLRTRYVAERGEPRQVIDPPGPVAFRVEELLALPAAEREGEARRLLAAEAGRPFDLAAETPLRALLVELDGTHQVLLLTLHHIAADGWSLRILARELAALYAAHRRGMEAALPPLPIQYADFAVWQRRFLAGPERERQLGFWQAHLAGELPVLELPADFPRPPVQSFAGAVATAALPGELVSAAEQVGRGLGATLFMTLLAGFYATLGRFAGQDDLVVGSPIANRNRAEIEGVVGFFVNTLALRADLSGRPAFAGLLEQVRATTLGAYDHQDLPFELLVDALGTARDLSRNPVFQVLFDFHADLSPDMLPDPAGPRLGEVEIDNAICDLSLSAFAAGDGVLLGAQYATALFRRDTVGRLLAAYGRLLARAVAEPGRPLADLPLLSPAEEREILDGWSGRTVEPAAGELVPLPALLARRFAAVPGAPAIEAGGRVVTAGDLAAMAASLARRLAALGVGPEERVAVCLGRTPEMVAALLAVLAAGGAYVPFDAADPAGRLRLLLADASPRLLLVDATTADVVAALGGLGLPVVDLAALLADESPAPAPDPAAIDTAQAAYVIYTSGSTGTPKGAVISHGTLARFAAVMAAALGLSAADRVLQFATLSFDVTVEEIFPTLLAGATVVLAPEAQRLAPADLTALLESSAVTGLELPTHFWGEWVGELARRGARPPAALRYCIIGTERVPAEPLAAWRGFGAELVHVFGLTEVGVTSLAERITGASSPLPEGLPLPIGRPLPGTAVYLLDGAGLPVPAGVVGEIYLGGGGVARGYLDRPAETAARFVPDPWGSLGARLYRTGDLARFLPDGRAVFLARADAQLKLRGFRIEPGEIEAALADLPEVAAAAVAARGQGADRRLVAYLVSAPGAELPAVGALRRALLLRLPEPMVPAQFVELAALPLSSNGKVDRRALPEPAALRPRLESAYEAPRGELERTIAAVWREVLGLPQVGVDDSFFELGGNSLSIVRVHSRLAERGLDLSLVDLFTAPTIAALARLAGQKASANAAPAGAAEEGEPVAVVAMAGRFSGTRSLAEFWDNIKNGVDSVRRFSDEEMLAAGVDPETLALPEFVKAKGYLPDADLFDAGFFGLPPREAEILDPQHRIFLETAWEVLELAGCDPRRYGGRVGVYAGASPYYYYRENLHGNPAVESVDPLKIDFGNVSDFLPLRTSYLLDLDGPSVNVQSACSTSLTAIGHAYFSLLSGQCDLALAGGVSVLFPQVSGYFFHEANIWSRDGRCRSFDAQASGLVVGEGVGIVALKRLSDALADGDRIHAVIRGASIRNEGSAKVGFAAPGVEGQARMIREAIERSGIDPRTFGLVEAHGSATLLGDPAEVAGLTRAFRAKTAERGFCALGSVKSNIGHADIAAGVAGFLKAALSVRDGVIPASLHCETPNPALDLENSPFYVPATTAPWPPAPHPRRAGVSSIGVGGTNTHVVLEEAPEVPPADPPRRAAFVLPLSARTPTALAAARERLAAHLETHAELALADVAATLQLGRRPFEYRAAAVAATAAEAVAALRAPLPGGTPRPVGAAGSSGRAGVVFLFPGAAAELPVVGQGIYRSERVYREAVDHAAATLEPLLGVDLLPLLTAEPGSPADPLRAEPVLFVTSCAIAALWRSWGIEPIAVFGQGVGEIAAAWAAGALTLDQALRRVAARARVAAGLPPLAGAPDDGETTPPRIPCLPDLAAVRDLTPTALLEIGPGRSLGRLARGAGDDGPLALASLPTAAAGHVEVLRLLDTLGRLWAAGVPVDWACFQGGERRLKVELPTYPFERRRYFVEPPSERPAPAQTAAAPQPAARPGLAKRADLASWFYAPSWERAAGPRVPRAGAAGEGWLVFADRSGLGSAFVRRLEERGERVATVLPGAGFAEIDAGVYTVHPERPEDYAALFGEIAAAGAPPRRVVHLWSAAPATTRPLAAGPPPGYLALFPLARALAGAAGDGARLTVVTPAAWSVVGDEPLAATGAAVAGLCRVLPQEHPHLECRQVDVLPPVAGSREEERLVRHLHAECLDGAPPELAVAYRNGLRFVLRYRPVELPAALEADAPLAGGGVYLVTGGQGWLGFELGALLAERHGARLVLLGRTDLPPREEWDDLLAADAARGAQGPADGLDKTAWKIRQVRRLEAMGAEVLLLTADAADGPAMAAAFAATRERFGKIDGVLHAAGITDERHYFPISETTVENCRYQFAPKVTGLAVLEELLAAQPAGFCLVFSSIAALLGGLGFVNYTAANAVLDAHVEALNRRSPTHWVSVGWDGWLIGELVEEAARAEPGSLLSLAMTLEEGLAAVRRILARPDLGQVTVSTGDLELRLDRWMRLTGLRRKEAAAPAGEVAKPEPAAGHGRPNLSNAYAAPRNELERDIAAIWGELLGVDPVGVHDNFFELGGDSLLAVHLSAKMRTKTGVEVAAGRLLAAQTVAEQAVAVVQRMAEEAGDDALELLAGEAAG